MLRTRFSVALLAAALASCDVARSVTYAGLTDGCSQCHGDPTRATTAANPQLPAAPPVDTAGNSATTSIGVGAHQAHLTDGPYRQAIACSECHIVPGRVDSPGHRNGTVEVFPTGAGQLARARGAAPTWNADATCSNVYCHGATLGAGGSNQRPLWTKVDGTQAGCGTCHGDPPPSPHPASTDCASCHSGYAQTSVNVALHINGTVEISGLACATCHGDPKRAATAANPQLPAAPPVDTAGNSATTAIGVGAHQSHLTDGPLRQAIACSECHPVPSSLAHVDGIVDMAFGPLATASGTATTWDATARSCSNYCHGAVPMGQPSLGGTDTTPIWTKVDGTQAACGTCHGLPPPASQGHPSVTGGLTACVACHPGTMNSDGTINVAGGMHVNGVVDVQSVHPSGWSDPTAHGYAANQQGLAYCESCHGSDFNGGSSGISCNDCHGGTAWQTDCTFCHGDPSRTATTLNPQLPAAPPAGTQGQQATNTIAVGAHQQHLAAGSIANAFACTECHTIPTNLSHVDGQPPAMTWGPLATANGASPTWNRTTTQSCSNYCHGQTLSFGGTSSGGSDTTPVWTKVDGTQAVCGTCHATTQLTTGQHQVHISKGYSCGVCHSGYTATTASLAIHVNGRRDVGGANTSITSYDPSTFSCTPTCHSTRTW